VSTVPWDCSKALWWLGVQMALRLRDRDFHLEGIVPKDRLPRGSHGTTESQLSVDEHVSC